MESLERYSRQIRFSPIGESGQMELASKSVLIVGVGALGTVLANHLVRAGIGLVRIVDRDYVEMSNLQRQMLFDEQDVKDSLPKAVAAEKKLKAINSSVKIEATVTDVTKETLPALLEGVDLVLDGTDNFRTRFLLNDMCYKMGIPFAYGGAVSARGMSALFIPEKTPCLRCFINQGEGTGQTCDTIGVISPVVDIVASYQVIEVLKYLVNDHEALRGTLRSFDVWKNHQFDLKMDTPKVGCPTCQTKQYPALTIEEDHVTTLCGRETVQIQRKEKINLQTWADRLAGVSDIQLTPFLLRVQLSEGERLVLFPDGRVLVQGTEDLVRAKTLYSKYIGE
ncbi:ThiF family adenylyltransferase [Halalkalibacter akibai]|uniref:Molybdopterin biosynthesis protein MoeB n=1 Tax=Halalkalibacter akibai (strain ATCC 43226 / DSM 21942 / CIP 109018 / JCM 9157 / 1139) TaxID=1236973 RepID=W4QNJ7_HALA3|nr:ThiF family adenylyltransferase [Halalkalibacter akibai]GAE33457.1 molybdopterin biosynthesis protein MoeB [Halalkalibacter akibai JCM 9157]